MSDYLHEFPVYQTLTIGSKGLISGTNSDNDTLFFIRFYQWDIEYPKDLENRIEIHFERETGIKIDLEACFLYEEYFDRLTDSRIVKIDGLFWDDRKIKSILYDCIKESERESIEIYETFNDYLY